MLYLSRLARAKGVDDLIAGFAASPAAAGKTLVIAGNGPQAEELHAVAAASSAADRIRFLDDVSDDEKPALMAGCATFVLPSKPRPEFVETFGIALVEKMLAGGGPVITCDTGGIGEAVGETAILVPVEDPQAIADALDEALGLPDIEREMMELAARDHARQFDRLAVFDRLLARLPSPRRRRPRLLALRTPVLPHPFSRPLVTSGPWTVCVRRPGDQWSARAGTGRGRAGCGRAA